MGLGPAGWQATGPLVCPFSTLPGLCPPHRASGPRQPPTMLGLVFLKLSPVVTGEQS